MADYPALPKPKDRDRLDNTVGDKPVPSEDAASWLTATTDIAAKTQAY